MLKEQLRKARKAARMTQKDVADRLGVTESTYCGYETGKRQPEAMKIKKIAAILGVTGDYLLETGLEPSDAPLPVKGVDAIVCEESDEIQLIRLYRSLNGMGKSAALSGVEALAANPHFRKKESKTITA